MNNRKKRQKILKRERNPYVEKDTEDIIKIKQILSSTDQQKIGKQKWHNWWFKKVSFSRFTFDSDFATQGKNTFSIESQLNISQTKKNLMGEWLATTIGLYTNLNNYIIKTPTK